MNSQFLVRTGKARSSSRPCKSGLSERPQPVKTRLLARDRKIFCPSLQKIPDPLLTGEDAEIASTQTGRSPLQSKTPALLGCPTLLPARKDSVGIETGGGVFHNRAGSTTGKNLSEESIGFRGVRCSPRIGLEKLRYSLANGTKTTFSSTGGHPTICGWPIHT